MAVITKMQTEKRFVKATTDNETFHKNKMFRNTYVTYSIVF